MSNREMYEAKMFDVVDGDLNPMATLVKAMGVEILTEAAYPENVSFNLYDENKTVHTTVLRLFKKYPKSEYVFMHTVFAGEETTEPKQQTGGIVSYRAQRRGGRPQKIVSNIGKAKPGKHSEFVSAALEHLKTFKVQSKEIVESIRSDNVTINQKSFIYTFSDLLCRYTGDFFSYSLKTQEEKPEPQRHTAVQKEFVNPKNTLAIKTELYKTLISLKESDFNEKGMSTKMVEYKAAGKPVTTKLQVKRPVEDNPDNILLFPIDSKLFKPIAMREPLNKYDGKVFIAICTLIDFSIFNKPELENPGDNISISVTLANIHRAMGYKGRLSKKEAERIKASILKLATTVIYYDWTQEMGVRHINPQKAFDIWGNAVMYETKAQYMLEAVFSDDVQPFKGKKGEDGEVIGVEGIVIKAIPPIYAHAKLTKVIASIPLDWFDVKSLGKMTDRRNSLLRGLTERISTSIYYKDRQEEKEKKKVRLKRENYNVIVLDSFFYDSGIVVNNKQTRSQLIKDLEKILEEYKGRGIIKNYVYSGLYSIEFFV